MKITINGQECEQLRHIKNVNTLKQILLELIDVKYSPLEALKSNISAFFDLVEVFCKIKRKDLSGADKAKLTREITAVNSQRGHWSRIEDKKKFVDMYYGLILKMESLDILRGFRIGNSHGDFSSLDAESIRMSKVYSE